jgi:hypothetical protein
MKSIGYKHDKGNHQNGQGVLKEDIMYILIGLDDISHHFQTIMMALVVLDLLKPVPV